MKTIGVIAYQGDYERHLDVFRRLGVDARGIRRPRELASLSGLVVPGGESTTIGMLMERFGLMDPVRDRIEEGLPVMGTCAGAILLSREIDGSRQTRIGTLDSCILRNAYGRQIDSFDAPLTVLGDVLREPLTGIFIRAPRFLSLGPGVEPLATAGDDPVIVRAGNQLALTFHPELTGDTQVHELFLDMCR